MDSLILGWVKLLPVRVIDALVGIGDEELSSLGRGAVKKLSATISANNPTTHTPRIRPNFLSI